MFASLTWNLISRTLSIFQYKIWIFLFWKILELSYQTHPSYLQQCQINSCSGRFKKLQIFQEICDPNFQSILFVPSITQLGVFPTPVWSDISSLWCPAFCIQRNETTESNLQLFHMSLLPVMIFFPEGSGVGGAVRFLVVGTIGKEEGPPRDGAVLDFTQILVYLVHNISRSQLYLKFGHFGWLPSFFGQ